LDSQPNIVALIGMPGSGKTTLGRMLAQRLDLPFWDVDAAIEAQVGSSIRQWFEAHGEDAFRTLETDMLQQLVGRGPSVLSTGGGAVLRQVNRQTLRQSCFSVYLSAEPGTLWRRLRHDRSRPLLHTDQPLQRLRDLYSQRDPLYREVAQLVLTTDHGSLPLAMRELVAGLSAA
jgi:shikimate kinase